MILVVREHEVYHLTAFIILNSTEIKINYLPRILSIDEFKRVNGAMGINITDVESGCIFE